MSVILESIVYSFAALYPLSQTINVIDKGVDVVKKTQKIKGEFETVYKILKGEKSNPIKEECMKAFKLSLKEWSTNDDRRRKLDILLERKFEKFTYEKVIEIDEEYEGLKIIFFNKLNEYPTATNWLLNLKLDSINSKSDNLIKEIGILSENEILKNLNQEIDVEPDNYNYPTKSDFINGNFYVKHSIIENLKTNLKNKKKCLLLGKPSSGKTTIGKAFGYYYLQEENSNNCYYLDLRGNENLNLYLLLKELSRYNNENTLFIIDNCHTNIDATNVILEESNKSKFNKVKMLFVSRDINEAYAITDNNDYNYINYFSELELNSTIKLAYNETDIIRIINTISRKRNKEKDLGNINVVLDKINGSLHILKFYIEIWSKSKNKKLSDLDNEDIYNLITKKYDLVNNTSLIYITSLAKYEIGVELSAIKSNYNKLEKHLKNGTLNLSNKIIFNDLVEDLEKKQVKNLDYINFFHSTPAEVIYNSAIHTNLVTEKELFNFLKSYLKKLPLNVDEVFFKLKINTANSKLQDGLLEYFVDKKLFQKWIDKHKTNIIKSEQFYLCYIRLYSIINKKNKIASKFTKTQKEFFLKPENSKIIFNEKYFIRYRKLILKLSNTPNTKELVANMNFSKLGKVLNSNFGHSSFKETLDLFNSCNITWKNKNAFINELDFFNIGKKMADQNITLSSLGKFLKYCLGKNINIKKTSLATLLDAFNFKLLGIAAKESETSINGLKAFMSALISIRINKTKTLHFLNQLDLNQIAKNSINNEIGTIINFIRILEQLNLESSKIQQFVNSYNLSNLINDDYYSNFTKIENILKLERYKTVYALDDNFKIDTYFSEVLNKLTKEDRLKLLTKISKFPISKKISFNDIEALNLDLKTDLVYITRALNDKFISIKVKQIIEKIISNTLQDSNYVLTFDLYDIGSLAFHLFKSKKLTLVEKMNCLFIENENLILKMISETPIYQNSSFLYSLSFINPTITPQLFANPNLISALNTSFNIENQVSKEKTDGLLSIYGLLNIEGITTSESFNTILKKDLENISFKTLFYDDKKYYGKLRLLVGYSYLESDKSKSYIMDLKQERKPQNFDYTIKKQNVLIKRLDSLLIN